MLLIAAYISIFFNQKFCDKNLRSVVSIANKSLKESPTSSLYFIRELYILYQKYVTSDGP